VLPLGVERSAAVVKKTCRTTLTISGNPPGSSDKKTAPGFGTVK
jgi:hypothetical protein